jgi:DNA/RNA-binding domain of Phe-tRNA-synthetase-like protein
MAGPIEITLTAEFRAAFPGGVFGALTVRGCPDGAGADGLVAETRAVASRLRARFPGETIETDPVARAYAAYFRRHGARYPVVHQAKTVLAGRPIESPQALVLAMFAAELDSLVLTSGHDLDALQGPLHVDVARDGDVYTKISGKPQAVRPGDMVVRDREGIIACVVHGPDHRTRLSPSSTAALFGAWCPVDLSAAVAEAHLAALAGLIRRQWPDAVIDPPRVWTAAGEAPAGG